MFAELEKVMDFSIDSNDFYESMDNNVFGKKSAGGIRQTKLYLTRLYGFDITYRPFIAFKYFWKISEPTEKPLIAFIYAINHDDILAESIQVLLDTKPGDKASVEVFEEVIEKYHPNQYSPNTLRSMAQNIASSWKQVGFIQGKVKNLRIQPKIGYRVACFAFLLAYLKGDRGDFIWNSTGVKSLCLSEKELRELAVECAKNDMIQYQHAGSVTSIAFNNLLNKIGINGDTN